MCIMATRNNGVVFFEILTPFRLRHLVPLPPKIHGKIVALTAKWSRFCFAALRPDLQGAGTLLAYQTDRIDVSYHLQD